ncbi:hypothetical protein CBD41_05575 [bacterium TMED181]|nr:hypothetical protein [Planctomycetota bacterium]OUW44520.1 MAG: hypothetical protein CBD41_05575 [bacterium TMED181]
MEKQPFAEILSLRSLVTGSTEIRDSVPVHIPIRYTEWPSKISDLCFLSPRNHTFGESKHCHMSLSAE